MLRWISKMAAAVLVFLLSFGNLAMAQVAPEDRYFINPEYSKRISMDFKDASLTDILKMFSQQAGKNFIATQDVGAKRITLFFENIPVEEALEQILQANELEYEEEPGTDIIVVRPRSIPKDPIITKIYRLKFATVPSAKINSTVTPGSNSFSSSSTSRSAASPMASQTASGSGLGFATGLYAAIKAILSKNGIIVEDYRTNSFVITDVQSVFPLVEKTIEKLDVPIPQILIQVEMLDISKNTSDLIGVKWGNTPYIFNGSVKGHLLPFDQSALLQKIGTGPIALDTGENSSSDENSNPTYLGGAHDFRGLTALVNFLKTRTDTRSLARPRILTLNNETAEIKISTDEAIGVTTTNFSSSSAASSAVAAERVQTGVFLVVTPQANPDTQEITMALYPKVIEARSGGTFEGHTFKDPEERGTQSILKVKDGETIVIGGLLRSEGDKTITKVPFLGDIPLLGLAFRHKSKTGNKRELIIFLTPHIVTEAGEDPLVHRPSRPNDSTAQFRVRYDAIKQALSAAER